MTPYTKRGFINNKTFARKNANKKATGGNHQLHKV